MQLPLGFKFLRPSALRHWDRFPSYADIIDKTPTAWFDSDHPPALPLFVSHRWLARDTPDPDGEQLGAVQQLLQMIAQVANAVRQGPGDRTRVVATPYVHGLLQAFSIIGAAHGSPEDEHSEWQSWARCWERMLRVPADQMGEAVVEEIGIWYDFSCVPTSSADLSGAHHSEEVLEALHGINRLVAACPVVVLRSEGDAYDGRGWCAAELSIGREHHKHIVLRTDLIGQPIRRRAMVADGDPFQSWLGTGRLLKVLDDWTSEEAPLYAGHLYRIHIDYEELAQLETGRPTPYFATPRRPDVFVGLRHMLVTMIERLGELSRADTRRGSLAKVDLTEIIKDAMAAAGLRCSVVDDIVFVGCMILEARNIRAPELAGFYRDAQKRWINGQTLTLVHYRERRRPVHVSFWRVLLLGREPPARAWYLFADEEIETRPRPKWARQKWLSRLLGLLEAALQRGA
jgi:hypothetical protein